MITHVNLIGIWEFDVDSCVARVHLFGSGFMLMSSVSWKWTRRCRFINIWIMATRWSVWANMFTRLARYGPRLLRQWSQCSLSDPLVPMVHLCVQVTELINLRCEPKRAQTHTERYSRIAELHAVHICDPIECAPFDGHIWREFYRCICSH